MPQDSTSSDFTQPVRTRFAPSPTGFLHLGNVRTALFNWMMARKHGGTFVLRIEDTDQERNTPEAQAVIFEGLRWLGLQWDEGAQPGKTKDGEDGPYGPYFQSQRNAIYERYLEKLQEGGYLYEDQGAIRFRSARKVVTVNDLICGSISFDLSNPITHPDMTIRRPDGSWIFHFVNVVDDIEMKISHVIRGEDHLSNTPKHIELYQALGVHPPHFAHMPLILNQDGSKMSKRNEGAHLSSYQKAGYPPEALCNYLCLLGWSPKDNREILPMEEIISLFELSDINRRGAAFDPDKCFWMQSQYLLNMTLSRYKELALPYLQEAGFSWPSEAYLDRVLALVKPKVKHLTEIASWVHPFMAEQLHFDEAAVEKNFSDPEVAQRLSALISAFKALPNWSAPELEQCLKATATQLEIKPGKLIHPTRVATTGSSVGAGLYETLELLGQATTLQRLQNIINND